jgi:multidrug efflux pump subunit AcrA (membrane-fusion protein)
VNPTSRTAKLRVEVPNRRGDLRLGMYADVVVTGRAGSSVVMIPRSAVQNVGDRTVVYLANTKEPGTVVEREGRLGPASGDQAEVTAGVQPGDLIVTQGSFLGSRPNASASACGQVRAALLSPRHQSSPHSARTPFSQQTSR